MRAHPPGAGPGAPLAALPLPARPQPQEAVMVAKRFFYVCAGIFLLAVAYHLGARSATAQGSLAECVGFDDYSGSAIINRELWVALNTSPIRVEKVLGGPVPGTARVVACGYKGVVLENGEVYRNPGGGWEDQGTFPFSGVTAATQETWGGVKARYRQGADAATPQDK